jgi:pimeloyl-ACP methyl ester carboxylesterase
MPVRLNGVVAAPTEGGPYPVALILHGTHPGCPVDDNGVDSWPCDPEDEQANFAGFTWLAEQLAARGTVAVAINLNAEYTLGFGETTPGQRLTQLVDRHLVALADAASGGEADFGIDLAERADLDQLLLVGHSRGGESAMNLAKDWAAQPDTGRPYGPAEGLLLLAPAIVFGTTEGPLPAPTAVVLPSCDADVREQDGLGYLESARLVGNDTWATAAWLEGANHNNVNTALQPDAFGLEGRPDCDGAALDPAAQRDFVGAYAADFVTAVTSDDAAEVAGAASRMGIDPAAPASGTLYGLPAQAALLLPDDQRLPLLTPSGEGQLAADTGATLAVDGVATLLCPAGYYTPEMAPDRADCRRAQLVVPGSPALAQVSWQASGGSMALLLDEPVDLSRAASLSLRVAVDPLSSLNPSGQAQAFSLRITDAAGKVAEVPVGADADALRYPAGITQDDEYFEGQRFTGPVPLMPVRVPLSAFAGVDLAAVTEVALVFDQTSTGTLLVADLEVLRSA